MATKNTFLPHATAHENQIEHQSYVEAAQMAYGIAREYLPLYTHAKSPHHFTFQQLGAIALLRRVARLSYREMQRYLIENGDIRATFKLRAVPDYSTLMRSELKMQTQLEQMLNNYLLQMQAKEIPLVWVGFLGMSMR